MHIHIHNIISNFFYQECVPEETERKKRKSTEKLLGHSEDRPVVYLDETWDNAHHGRDTMLGRG